MTANTPDAQTPIPGSELFIHNKDSARAYWWLGTLWIVLADSSDTGGRFSLMEEVAPKGSGPGPHKHTWSDETYYIMDGEITFLVGDKITTARTGDYVMVPRNTPHAFRVESEQCDSSMATRPPASKRMSWSGQCRHPNALFPLRVFPRRWSSSQRTRNF